jgi:hypothetical protein
MSETQPTELQLASRPQRLAAFLLDFAFITNL